MKSLLLTSLLVGCILSMSSPTAVFGAVIPVNVNAVNLSSGEVAWGHIGYEGGQIVPAIAHRYAPSSVAVEPCGLRAVASMVHCSPLNVQRVSIESVLSDRGALPATATAHSAILKLVQSDYVPSFAAITPTNANIPVCTNAPADGLNSKAPKLLSYLSHAGFKWEQTESCDIQSITPAINGRSIVAAVE